jgi:hypothetical protein
MTINNPTEFRFNHDRLRANNVVIIPTPTNNSNLNSIMESNNDFNQYYNFGNYTDVRYYKTVTPKTSISGMNVNCYKENDTPQSATVYKANNTYHVETTGYTGQTVSFNHQDVIFNSENIPDEEIFFKDSENAPIALTVFDDTNSVTLTNHATKDSFEFKVPSCVHKVEIEHNTSHEAPAGSNKAKIHIDLDDSSKDYYINEKNNNTDNTFSIVSSKPIPCRSLFKLHTVSEGYQTLYSDTGDAIDALIAVLLKTSDLASLNGESKTFTLPLYNLYWHYEKTINGTLYYLYTCLRETLVEQELMGVVSTVATYTPVVCYRTTKDEGYTAFKLITETDTDYHVIDFENPEVTGITEGVALYTGISFTVSATVDEQTNVNTTFLVESYNSWRTGLYVITDIMTKFITGFLWAFWNGITGASGLKIPVITSEGNYIVESNSYFTVTGTGADIHSSLSDNISSLPAGSYDSFSSITVSVPEGSGNNKNYADYPNANLDFGALCDSILSTN